VAIPNQERVQVAAPKQRKFRFRSEGFYLREFCVALTFLGLAAVSLGCDANVEGYVKSASDGAVASAWSGSEVNPALLEKGLPAVVAEAESCRQADPTRQILKLAVFSSAEDRNQFFNPSKATHFSFGEWLARYKQFHPKPLAMVSIIGDTEIARRLTGEGRIESSTKGPQVAGFEILDIAIRQHVPGTAGNPAGKVTLYARSHLTEEQVKNNWASVIEPSHFPNVSMLIRSDAWFIRDPNFPIGYVFDETKPPLPDKYPSAQLALNCERHQGTRSCASDR
jgi:hypothetical protein